MMEAAASKFDPDRLIPLASLNAMPLHDSAAWPLASPLEGRTAYHVLAAGAIAARVRSVADTLGIADAPARDDATLLRQFDGALDDPTPAIRAAARALADRLGETLGALLVTLRRGGAATRAARPEWGDGHWTHWAAITTIHLGGGLASGQLGVHLAARAAEVLCRAGMADCAVGRAAWPTQMPLLGAARAVPRPAQMAITFDFGQSFVKRAYARYDGEALASLRLLPALPIREQTAAIGAEPEPALVQALAERLIAIVAETWATVRGAGWDLDPAIALSLACYLHDGQPLPRRGSPYASLRTLSPHLTTWLADRLMVALGLRPELTLLHDSTAAALAVPRDPHAAVIMLGTALGVGFPSQTRAIRPLAAGFVIEGQ